MLKDKTNVAERITMLKSLVDSKLDKVNRYYKMGEDEKISDPKVSELHFQKGDEVLNQVEAIKATALIFGYKFNVVDSLDDGKLRMSTITKVRGGSK